MLQKYNGNFLLRCVFAALRSPCPLALLSRCVVFPSRCIPPTSRFESLSKLRCPCVASPLNCVLVTLRSRHVRFPLRCVPCVEFPLRCAPLRFATHQETQQEYHRTQPEYHRTQQETSNATQWLTGTQFNAAANFKHNGKDNGKQNGKRNAKTNGRTQCVAFRLRCFPIALNCVPVASGFPCVKVLSIVSHARYIAFPLIRRVLVMVRSPCAPLRCVTQEEAQRENRGTQQETQRKRNATQQETQLPTQQETQRPTGTQLYVTTTQCNDSTT
jgi:hypothetical protein